MPNLVFSLLVQQDLLRREGKKIERERNPQYLNHLEKYSASEEKCITLINKLCTSRWKQQREQYMLK